MLQLSLSIIGILITIFFVIGTHEAAHFIAARLLGVKVLRFSIGFGKSLWRYRDRKGTEYVLAVIPLGGYVKMLDEREEPVPKHELHRSYNQQPLYKKLLIVIAGPVMNLFCAFVLYWVIFIIGFTAFKPIVGSVSPRSIASESGLQPNQEILTIDHHETRTWTKVVFRLLAHAGDEDRVVIETKDIKTNAPHDYVFDLSNWHVHGLMPDPLGSLGITPYEPKVPLIIGQIADKSPAATSPLKIGDKILATDKKAVSNWDELVTTIVAQPSKKVIFTVLRNGKKLNLPVEVGEKRRSFYQKIGYLGIGPQFTIPDFMLHKVQYPPFQAVKPAYEEVENLSYFNLLLFGKLITGKLSLETLGGPITIFENAGESLNYGILAYLGFLAFLSVAIGIINLFPIPGLDGGHVFILLIEAIIRRPLPDVVVINLYRVGFLFLIFIFLQALVNDILRLY